MNEKIPGIPGVPSIEELLNECTTNNTNLNVDSPELKSTVSKIANTLEGTKNEGQDIISAFEKTGEVSKESIEEVNNLKYETPGNIPPVNLN